MNNPDPFAGLPALEPQLNEVVPVVHILGDLFDNPELLRPPEPIVRRFAYRGRLTLFPAPRKSGKSTLIAAMAAAASSGTDFLGESVPASSVLWAALDEPLNDTVRRFHALGADRSLFVAEGLVTVAQLANSARELGVDLLIIDTLSDLLAREHLDNENGALEVKRALQPLRTLARDTGIAVVLLHHTGKATGKSRGSGVFEDMADLILHLSVSADNPALRKIDVEGRLAVDSFTVTWGESGFELGGRELTVIERVRLAVQARPGMSKRQVREVVTGRTEEINAAIGRLQIEGVVVDRGSKTRSELFFVENPGNHPGNHLANHPGTARESPGTTWEPLRGMAGGSPPVGGTAYPGTGTARKERAA